MTVPSLVDPSALTVSPTFRSCNEMLLVTEILVSAFVRDRHGVALRGLDRDRRAVDLGDLTGAEAAVAEVAEPTAVLPTGRRLTVRRSLTIGESLTLRRGLTFGESLTVRRGLPVGRVAGTLPEEPGLLITVVNDVRRGDIRRAGGVVGGDEDVVADLDVGDLAVDHLGELGVAGRDDLRRAGATREVLRLEGQGLAVDRGDRPGRAAPAETRRVLAGASTARVVARRIAVAGRRDLDRVVAAAAVVAGERDREDRADRRTPRRRSRRQATTSTPASPRGRLRLSRGSFGLGHGTAAERRRPCVGVERFGHRYSSISVV